jgi:hypothetical protein
MPMASSSAARTLRTLRASASEALRWQPDPATELFFGYQYEHYWNAGRMNIPNDTMAEVYARGVVLRASCSF